MKLRPYQIAAIERCRSLVNAGRRRILIQAPCGAGKGAILSAISDSTVARGNRVLSIVHRRELVEDLADRIAKLGHHPGLILPGHPEEWRRPIQVASVQTLARREKPVAHVVLVDECHHATASTWLAILDCYPEAVIVGSTATPCRLSGAPLGDLFEELVSVVQPAELVEAGHLVPAEGFAFDAPDLRNVRRIAGDYAEDELAKIMGSSRIRGSVVSSYMKHAGGARAIVFAVNVAHSKALAAEFNAAGVPALHLDGEASREERARTFDAFRTGRARVLCNVQLFTEGVDLPAIELVILARPTLSLSLALQMIGRGRRPLPCACGAIPHWRAPACECGRPVAKRRCRIHDHAGVIFEHGLPDEPRVWSLSGEYRVDPKNNAKPSAALRTCERCFGIYLADAGACPLCGHANAAGARKLIRNAVGVPVALADIERAARREEEIANAPENERKRFYLYLLGLERQRGYKRGYATVRYWARFKRWPATKAWDAEFEKRQQPQGSQA